MGHDVPGEQENNRKGPCPEARPSLKHERTRSAIEADLRESEERFNLMSEHAPVMIWMSDANGHCLHLNRMLREFWGVANDSLATFDWTTTMHPDDQIPIGQAMMAAMARRESVSIKGRYRRADGTFRVLQTDARPRLANGEFLGMIGVNIDITERETAEAARRLAESDREFLVSELKHRVNNTLSVVQGIARLTFRTAPEAAHAAFSGRLAAMSRSHDLLTQSKWEQVSLQGLAETALRPGGGVDGRISLHGPLVLLPPRHALAMGMVLHELFTNAVKYGALSTATGAVALEWSLAADGRRFELRWHESGGPAVSVPDHKGFGSVLLERSLQGELDGRVDMRFLPTGLVCTISARLAASPDPS